MDTSLDEQQATGHSLVNRATFLDQLFSTPFLGRHLPQQCERRLGQGEVINTATGELSPHMCGANTCPYCVKVKRRQVTRAAGAANPSAFLTLTRAGDDIAEISTRMRNVRRNLRRKGFALEWVWVVECNGRRNGRHEHHVHALAHGAIPPDHVLSELAKRAGFGPHAEVKAVSNADAAAGYLWSKRSKWRVIDQPHRLWTNGGRLQHSSRNYWRVNGENVAGMDAAIKSLRGQRAA